MPDENDQGLRRMLADYEIGSKIRALRLRKKIALVDLGKHTGLSASMLSQLENGKLIPTLPTLARIAMVFDVGVDYFFTDRTKPRTLSIVRAADRIKFPVPADEAEHPNYFFENLAFEPVDKPFQAYLAEFPPISIDRVQDHAHEGIELLHIVRGGLVLRYSGKETELYCGDTAYFDSSEPHGYRGLTDAGASAVVVTAVAKV